MRDTVLWMLKKDGDTIRAVMSAVDGGLELRLMSGSLQVFRQLCQGRSDLQLLATREHAQLIAKGWELVPLRDELTEGDQILPGDTVRALDSVELRSSQHDDEPE